MSKDHLIVTGIGARRAIDLAVRLPEQAWTQISAGTGAKGERLYDWAWIETVDPRVGPGYHWLLIRRSISTGEYAFYRAYSPEPVTLAVLARTAGTRWRVEEGFQTGKGLAALDEHQVRTWTSWQRWTLLGMIALAFLSVMATTQPDPIHHDDQDLIPLTRNEICHLYLTLTGPTIIPGLVLTWSRWRRQHQARARRSHRKRQAIHNEWTIEPARIAA